MSDLIKALTSAPHGATHIGFYGDDIIFIKEYEESRSDAWGFDSKEWQDIEDFDVSLIYGVRAIKDVKTEAELLKQIEQIKAERDALAKEVDAANDRIGELTEDRDALAAQVEALATNRDAFREAAYKAISIIQINKIRLPQGYGDECLAEIRAEAGRAGYLQGYLDALGDPDEIDKEHSAYRANEHAATVRQGGAE